MFSFLEPQRLARYSEFLRLCPHGDPEAKPTEYRALINYASNAERSEEDDRLPAVAR